MCRGATASDPLQHPQYGSAFAPSRQDPFLVVQPILSFPYLQHPSQGTAIDDALASAQSEAAMWRAGFEKGQKLAQEPQACLTGETSRHEGVTATSMATVPSDAFAPQQNGSGWPEMRSCRLTGASDPWMLSLGEGARDLSGDNTNKQEQTPGTPSDVAWDLSTVFDDTDAVAFNDLTSLTFPSGSAPLEPTAVTPSLIENQYMQRCFDAYTIAPGAFYQTDDSPTFWQRGAYSQGFTDPQRLGSSGGPGWSPVTPLVTTPPVYITVVANMTEMREHPVSHSGTFAQTQDRAQIVLEGAPQMHFVGKQEIGSLKDPTRQSSAQFVRNVGDMGSMSKDAWVEAAGAWDSSAGHGTPKPECEGDLPFLCTGGPSRRGIAPGAHAVAENCSCIDGGGVACRGQPLYGGGGDTRSSTCRAHAKDGVENVRLARCQQQGCKRQPLYGEPGLDKKPTHCRTHALPGMRDLRGAMCQGAEGACGKRPSYGFRGNPRPTRCGTHKELGMEDLISARCNFPYCRTVASYGVQGLGSHVIRRTRCKAHRTPEMICGTKGPACMNPGGCETRPSYGWPDKCDGEQPPRPEHCKKHSLPGMEYMGSAARARKKRAMEATAEEPAPVAYHSVGPTTAQAATAIAAAKAPYTPPTGRSRLVRTRAPVAVPKPKVTEIG